MMKRMMLLIAAVLLASFPALAEDRPEPGGAPGTEAPEARSKSTRHSTRIDGQAVKYTATVGWLILENDKGEPHARFGYTAYTRDDTRNLARRPVMFAFNGGPGSSSMWLHIGILGPKRVVVTDEGFTPPPPSERVDNEFSVLDVTDIVMIDPVGTGFSKPLGDAKGEAFWGVNQDIESVGAFIKQYVTDNGRWASPKFLLGESYGGIRAAGLVAHLQERHGMNFNGVIMVSPFMSVTSGVDSSTNDLPHVLYLSTLAATAWYHDLVPDKPASLERFVEEVDRFAYDVYAPALLKGSTIPEDEKGAVAERLAAYTGTGADFWMKADLRAGHLRFAQELQRDQRIVTGRIDSRFIGPAINPLSERMDYDPFFPAVAPAFTAAFLDYLHNELEFGKDETYVVSAFGLEWDWRYRPPGSGGGWAAVADLRPALSRALTLNPGLHLLVQQGYYDLATPMQASKHDVSHLDIPPEARERIRMAYYEAGHMMYLHEPSMRKYRDDLASFIRDTDRL
jgi:carboxypeptidase C (cathepsin A)